MTAQDLAPASTGIEDRGRKSELDGSTSDNNDSADANQAQLISTIKAHIAAGDKAAQKANDHYISAGQHLATLKKEHAGSWAEWEELLKTKVNIGTGRASELMQIADGRKTVEQIRADASQRKRQQRLRDVTKKISRPSANGQPTDNAADPKASAKAMKAKLAALDAAPAKASWCVELTTDDGRRWVNGVRLNTKAEAGLYAHMGICDLPLPPIREESLAVVMMRVLPSADAWNCSLRYPEAVIDGSTGKRTRHRKAGQLCNGLTFKHGECHLHVWHPEDEPEPSCPAADGSASS